jgi:predicted Zn-dependent protease
MTRAPEGFGMRHGRFLVPATVMAVALIAWCGAAARRETSSGPTRLVTPEQEVEQGRRIAPELARLSGGWDSDADAQRRVSDIGAKLVAASPASKTPYRFQFRVLADTAAATSFSLPGGQVFVTRALLSRLASDDELAAVLAHEIAHVVGRHACDRLGDDPRSAARAARAFRYGTRDEIEADVLGVDVLLDARFEAKVLHDVVARLGDTELLAAHPGAEARLSEIDGEIVRRSAKS